MIASRERQHGDRVAKLPKFQTRILPITAIYGGNASGKTNLFKALNFAKWLVVRGTQPDSYIPVEPYRNNNHRAEQPSRFSFVIFVDEVIYDYSFTVTRRAVLEEKLVIITSTRERVLYHRIDGKPNFDDAIKSNQFLNFAFNGTRDNQLFLTNSVSQKVDDFRPVYDWFKNSLELVAPDSRFEPFELFLDETNPLYATMNEILPLLDTGITHLGGEAVPFDSLPIPVSLKSKLMEDIAEGMSGRISLDSDNERFVITRKDGDLVAQKMVTYHPKVGGDDIKFEVKQESDGTLRVIDLLPAFLELSAKLSKKVYVIDELDRSLHTLLTRKLLEYYLGSCSGTTRSQLLFTTHDVLLMDQQLLRRDEMWIAERDVAGASTLLSFAEYKDVRYDKDIRKSYLQGRLGGIPRIWLGDTMNTSDRLLESESDKE